jgi:hypothetical protein
MAEVEHVLNNSFETSERNSGSHVSDMRKKYRINILQTKIERAEVMDKN